MAISLEHNWSTASEQPFHAHLNCPEPLPSPIILHPFHVGERHRINHLKKRVRNQKVYFIPCKKKPPIFFLLLLSPETTHICYPRCFSSVGSASGYRFDDPTVLGLAVMLFQRNVFFPLLKLLLKTIAQLFKKNKSAVWRGGGDESVPS